jgi:hypothetical protein
MNEKSLLLKPHCGCRNAARIEKVSEGVALDNQDKVLKKRGKKANPELDEVKSDLLSHLMSKLPV